MNENLLKKNKLKIIIVFLKKFILFKKFFKINIYPLTKRYYSKKLLINYIILNYNKDYHSGIPDILIGSYNLNIKLLNNISEINDKKNYNFYKFLKQKNIKYKYIINCWYI